MRELEWQSVSSSVQCGAHLLAGRRVSSQNLIGSELLISRSVCVGLAPSLLQVVDPSVLLDIKWMEDDGVVNASGHSCQVDQCGACLLAGRWVFQNLAESRAVNKFASKSLTGVTLVANCCLKYSI